MASRASGQDSLVGVELGHYRIVEKIGAGGMGDVYRARDEHLARDVAIKVLPPATLIDESARKHFHKEALILSQLNHPNIATIYDFDTQQGVDILVMEYIPGATLSEKVATAPLPEKEVLRLGVQLAEGLAAAHDHGVVHRDLKPGNLRLTSEGRLKILDFGLAKLRLPVTATATTESLSDTQSMAGTLPYMAPEQLLGGEIDARTDIHAAGSVLYEMATGQRPFAELERSQLIGAILQRPRVTAAVLNPKLSPGLEWIIGKCLETEPQNRYQSAKELAIDLRRLLTPSAAKVAEVPVASRKLWKGLVPAALILVAAAIGGELYYRWRPSVTRPMEQRITANPPEAPITAAVISPDGKYVAYSDSTGTYLRHIDTGETRSLQLPKGFDAFPTSWFPDSTDLLLSSGGFSWASHNLWKISILGGGPRKVVENARAGKVSPDGSHIAFVRDAANFGQELWVLGTDGSNPRRVLDAARATELGSPGNQMNDHHSYARPVRVGIGDLTWSPHGGQIAFNLGSVSVGVAPVPHATRFALGTVDTNGGRSKALMSSAQAGMPLVWAADGRLLYPYRENPSGEGSDFGIWSLRVDEKSGEAKGEPLQLTTGAGQIGALSISADGKRIVLLRVTSQPTIFVTEIDPETRRLKGSRRLTLDENGNVVSAWTPDSRSVVFVSNRNGTWKLFRQDLNQVTPEVLVEGRNIYLPRLNPDGTQILYLVGASPGDPAHLVSVMRVPLQGGSPQLVLQKPNIGNIQCGRSPFKACLLDALIGSKERKEQLFWFDPENGKTQQFVTLVDSDCHNWSLSPDGSQLALVPCSSNKVTFMAVSDKSTHEVEINEWAMLSTVDWAADGKSVFLIAHDQNGTSVVLNLEPSAKRRVLLGADKRSSLWWAIPAPDGRHVALEEVAGENNIWMVENF
jgi:serine/threonine protein kinase